MENIPTYSTFLTCYKRTEPIDHPSNIWKMKGTYSETLPICMELDQLGRGLLHPFPRLCRPLRANAKDQKFRHLGLDYCLVWVFYETDETQIRKWAGEGGGGGHQRNLFPLLSHCSHSSPISQKKEGEEISSNIWGKMDLFARKF